MEQRKPMMTEEAAILFRLEELRQEYALEKSARLKKTGAEIALLKAEALREAAAELKKIEPNQDSWAYKMLCEMAEKYEKDMG